MCQTWEEKTLWHEEPLSSCEETCWTSTNKTAEEWKLRQFCLGCIEAFWTRIKKAATETTTIANAVLGTWGVCKTPWPNTRVWAFHLHYQRLIFTFRLPECKWEDAVILFVPWECLDFHWGRGTSCSRWKSASALLTTRLMQELQNLKAYGQGNSPSCYF